MLPALMASGYITADAYALIDRNPFFIRRIAELFRSEGQGEAARIQGERERDLQRIQSEAFRTAEELRGKADAEATDIYAGAYNRDADFYAFTRSLESYEKIMDPQTMFILGTDSELLKYLDRPR